MTDNGAKATTTGATGASVTFSTGDVAQRLGVSRETVRLWCQNGLLPSRRLSPAPGSPRRISENDLSAFIAGQDRSLEERDESSRRVRDALALATSKKKGKGK